MKKMMKFVKGKKEDETQVKNAPVELRRVSTDKSDDYNRDEDFVARDKSITKLHKAVWNENSDKLKSIIKTHDIDITDKLDRTALYFGVLKNNPVIVNLLLESGANQNIPDIDGITPFLKSAQLGYIQCAIALLNYGADTKKTDKDLNSCVHFAVMGRHIDMIAFLLKQNADCNVSNAKGDYPLHIATKSQNIHMVELLLNYNADMHVPNSAGLTPVMLATQQGNKEIISLFETHNFNRMTIDDSSTSDEYTATATPLQKVSNESLTVIKSGDLKYYSKNDSDADTWNDSPIASPSRKPNDKLPTKIFFSEETDISEKSESEMSIKCSENTSPQSGIIPPPCKPLRSLEYLQSGLAMEGRPVHLLTLGTVRTRHISMTESEHSKNNTPHRYSYQGDFHLAAGGDSHNKIPDHYSCTGDDKGDSVNASAKSKMLSKLECDSTVQSDWGSDESLPLDEISYSGRPIKNIPGSTPKHNSNSSNIRNKTTDTFLQKQFSILEDYEKKHEKHCSVSYEKNVLVLDKNSNSSESHLDDISHLLEDNNRINAQLEKYVVQADATPSTTKSKSLPRNCEPCNSYHKGSFSLPRTLESGKDPFREMRSYGYFRPRSHFFSLKMLKGEKRTGFIDKLKNMFNKKSQVHLQDQNENGTWLYKDKSKASKSDSESNSGSKTSHHCRQDSSHSGSEKSESRRSNHSDTNISENKLHGDFCPGLKELEEDDDSIDLSFTNNERNTAIEKQILAINNMSGHSRHPSSSQSNYAQCSHENCPKLDEQSKSHKTKSLFSVVKKNGLNSYNQVESVFCEECSEFMNVKLAEAEQNIKSKESFINLLQNQLLQLKERNVKSINEAQEINYKYGVATQELVGLKQICKKYDDELQNLRAERANKIDHERDATKLREEAEKWKKQYEELIAKIHNVDSANSDQLQNAELLKASDKVPSSTEAWRNVIQTEVSTFVSILKENSQTVISSLEKQNQKLETLIEKLHTDLNASTKRQQELEHELHSTKNELTEVSTKAEKIKSECEKSCEDTVKSLQNSNKKLRKELDNITKMYTELQHEYEENVMKIGKDIEQSSQMTSEFEMVKEEYKSLACNMSELAKGIEQSMKTALVKNASLRTQVIEIDSSEDTKKFLHKITESLESVEMTSVPANTESNTIKNNSEFVIISTCNNALCDIEKINQMNSELKVKIQEIRMNKTVSQFKDENNKLKEDLSNQSKVIDDLEYGIQNLQEQVTKNEIEDEILQEALQKNENLEIEIRQSYEEKNSMITELEQKDTVIKNQLLQLSKLNETLRDKDQKSELLEKEMEIIKCNMEIKENTNCELNRENMELKSKLDSFNEEQNRLKRENERLNSFVTKLTEEKDELNEKYTNTLAVTEDLKKAVGISYVRIEKLEMMNQELKTTVESIKNIEHKDAEEQIDDYKSQMDALYEENNNIKEQFEKEKSNNAILQKRIDSLKFYHDNEMIANNARLQEMKQDNEKIRETLQSDLQELQNENILLKQKLESLEQENINLEDKIAENTNIISLDPQMQDAAFGVMNKENKEMKSAMNVLRDILEERLGEKFNSDKTLQVLSNELLKNNESFHSLVAQSKVDEETNSISSTSPEMSLVEDKTDNTNDSDENEQKETDDCCNGMDDKKEALVQRLNSIETKIDTLINNDSSDVKSTSMPNLDQITDSKIMKLSSGNMEIIFPVPNVQSTNNFVRKTSSLDCLAKNCLPNNPEENINECCKTKWDIHLESIHRLRTELSEIIQKLDLRKKDRKTAESATNTSTENTDRYKQLISSLQRQVNELQVKSAQESSKCYGLQAELRGLKGQMVAKSEMEEEICKLRRELFKQRVERLQDIERTRIKKEAEILAVQQKLKQEYLLSKEKLLSDLSAVQTALQNKNDEEQKLKKKCEQLVKEVTTSQEARKKQLHDISHRTQNSGIYGKSRSQTAGPSRPVHHSPPRNDKHTCQKAQPSCCQAKNKKSQATVINVRAKLNTAIEKHRFTTESAPQSSQDEDLKKKYLLK